MPSRKIVLSQNEIYHVINRGVAESPVFLSPKDYKRFLNLTNYYKFANVPMSFSNLKKLELEQRTKILENLNHENKIHVEILAFCLMPNHFHFLLKQITDDGITSFMKNLENAYVRFFNIKTSRIGPLFQSIFKAVRVETDEQLLHVSRYIHLNPSTSYIVKIDDLLDYEWSSFNEYLTKNTHDSSFINTEAVLGLIDSPGKYKEFVFDQAEYQKELDKIKHIALD